MARGKRNRRTSGSFIMLLHNMMNSEAWQDLSGNAVKVLLHLMKLSHGNNGYGHKAEPGQLFLSERVAAKGTGLSRNTASKALSELLDHGFLRVVCAGHFKVKLRQATIWRLTFEPYPLAHRGPTNEWRNWKPEKKLQAQNLNRTGAKIGHNPSIPAFTGLEIDPVERENSENPPNPGGSIVAPHIDIPWGASPSARTGAEVLQFDPSPPGSTNLGREDCMTPGGWPAASAQPPDGPRPTADIAGSNRALS
ncbi:MAG: hypothetical protein ABIQ32_13115 [Sphingomicrobium sp.]